MKKVLYFYGGPEFHPPEAGGEMLKHDYSIRQELAPRAEKKGFPSPIQ